MPVSYRQNAVSLLGPRRSKYEGSKGDAKKDPEIDPSFERIAPVKLFIRSFELAGAKKNIVVPRVVGPRPGFLSFSVPGFLYFICGQNIRFLSSQPNRRDSCVAHHARWFRRPTRGRGTLTRCNRSNDREPSMSSRDRPAVPVNTTLS